MTAAPRLLDSLSRALADVPGPDAAASRAALERVLRGEVETLDEAFELKSAPGERRWQTQAAQSQRDDLIRRAAAEHFTGMTAREAAERIASELNRFRNSHDWRRSRAEALCPFVGAKAAWWAILRLRDWPLGPSRIRQVLANMLPSTDWPRDA